MAATGYMTEADTEAFWATSLNTERYDLINQRISELLNFECHDDAATDITDARVLPILEQITEEVFFELLVAAKGVGEATPWQVAQGTITSVFNRMIGNYWRTIQKIRQIIGEDKMELVSRHLPSSSSDW